MAALEGHSSVVHKDTLYIFGGIDQQTGLLSNCTWSVKMSDVLDNSAANMNRQGPMTVTLNLVQCRGHFPPPRCYHACTLRGPFMVISGGETGTIDDARDRRVHQLNQFRAAGVSSPSEDISLFDDEDDDVISNASDDDDLGTKQNDVGKTKSSALVGRIQRGLVIYTLNLETLLWSRHHLKYSFESHDGWVLRTQQTLKKLQSQQQAAATLGQGTGKNGAPSIKADNLLRLNEQALMEAGVGRGAASNDDKASSLALAQATDTVLEAAGLSFTDMALAAVKRRCHATLLSCPETILFFGGYPIERSQNNARGMSGIKAQTMFEGHEQESQSQSEFSSLFPGGSRSMYNGSAGGLLKQSSPLRSKRLGTRDSNESLTVEPSCFYRLFEISGHVDVGAVDSVGSVPMLWGHSAVRCHNSIIVFGGIDARGGSETSSLCVYSLEDRRWRWVDQHLANASHLSERRKDEAGPTPRALHSAVVHRASMIVHGGFNTNDPSSTSVSTRPSVTNAHMNDTWVFSLNTGQWELWECGGEQPIPRSGHTSLIYDDFMLVIGGLETRINPPPMEFPPPATTKERGGVAVQNESPTPNTIAVLDTIERVWRIKEIKTNISMEQALRNFVPSKRSLLDQNKGEDALFTGRAGLLLNPYPLHSLSHQDPYERPQAPLATTISGNAISSKLNNDALLDRKASPVIESLVALPQAPAISPSQTQLINTLDKRTDAARLVPPGLFSDDYFAPQPDATHFSSLFGNFPGTVSKDTNYFDQIVPSWDRSHIQSSNSQPPNVSSFQARPSEAPPQASMATTNVEQKPAQLSFKQFSAPQRQSVPTVALELDDDELPRHLRKQYTKSTENSLHPRATKDSYQNESMLAQTASRASTPMGEERKARLRQMRQRQSSQLGDSSRASPTASQPHSAVATPVSANVDTDNMYDKVNTSTELSAVPTDHLKASTLPSKTQPKPKAVNEGGSSADPKAKGSHSIILRHSDVVGNKKGRSEKERKSKPNGLSERPEWNSRTLTPSKKSATEASSKTKKAPTKIIRSQSFDTDSSTSTHVPTKETKAKSKSLVAPSSQNNTVLTESEADSIAAETQTATSTAARLLAEELVKLQQIQAIQQEKQLELQKRQMQLMEALIPNKSQTSHPRSPLLAHSNASFSITNHPYQAAQQYPYQALSHPHSTGKFQSSDAYGTLLYNPYRSSPTVSHLRTPILSHDNSSRNYSPQESNSFANGNDIFYSRQTVVPGQVGSATGLSSASAIHPRLDPLSPTQRVAHLQQSDKGSADANSTFMAARNQFLAALQ